MQHRAGMSILKREKEHNKLIIIYKSTEIA